MGARQRRRLRTSRAGRVPMLVGGTGFYLRALRQPLFVSPPTDESLRRRLNRIREKHGAEHLHRLLSRLDPAAVTALPTDWPRVTRAIEVYLQTGKSIVDQQPERPEPHESSHRLEFSPSTRRGMSFTNASTNAPKHTSGPGLLTRFGGCWTADSHLNPTRSAPTVTAASSSIYRAYATSTALSNRPNWTCATTRNAN